MKKPIKRLHSIKSLSNNYRSLTIITAFLLTSLIGIAQSAMPPHYDSTRALQPVNSDGFYWTGTGKFGGALIIPRDTFKLKYSDSGSIAYKSKKFWLWSGTSWSLAIGGGSANVGDSLIRLFDSIASHTDRMDTIQKTVYSSDGSITFSLNNDSIDIKTNSTVVTLVNQLISTGGIILEDSTVSIVGPIIYRINGIKDTIGTGTDWVFHKTAAGYKRTDAIIINNAGILDTLVGVPDTIIAVPTLISSNALLISYINVYHDSISTPTIANTVQLFSIPSVDSAGKLRYDSLALSMNQDTKEVKSAGGFLVSIGKRIAWGDASTSIYYDGTNFLNFDSYDGNFSWRRSNGGLSTIMQLYDNNGSTSTGYINLKSFGIGTASPNASAALDLTSTIGSFIPPRMNSTQMNALISPPDGSLLYNPDSAAICLRSGGVWRKLNISESLQGLNDVLTVNDTSSKSIKLVYYDGFTPINGVELKADSDLSEGYLKLTAGAGVTATTTYGTTYINMYGGGLTYFPNTNISDGIPSGSKYFVRQVNGTNPDESGNVTISGGSGITYAVQSTAPSDSTTFWLDNSSGAKGVWPIKQKLVGEWRTIKWYDPVAKLVRNERPLYILLTAQSNGLWRTGGGDTARDGRVLYGAAGVPWGIAAPVAPGANNIGYQAAKCIAKYYDRIVRFTVVAEASRPLSDWLPGGAKTIEIANLVRELGIDSFNVIMFRQGERNAELGFTETQYSNQMDSVLNAYRDSSWFGKSGRAILGGMNEAYINTGVFNYYYHLNNVDRSKIGVVGVSTLGFSQSGGIHQDGRTIDSVGYNYFRAWEGMGTQYSLEKTPNIGWISDTELGIWPYGTNRPTIRLQYSKAFGNRGGYIKYNDSTSQLLLGYNPTNNGNQYSDSNSIFINANSQVGIGNINNTLTTNRAQMHIRSQQPIAFSVGSGRDNAKFQIDSTGSLIKPLCFRDMYSRDGNIIFQQLSGDTANGLIRYTRLTGPTLNNYRGVYTFFNGATNLYIIGGHPTTDGIWWNDVPVLAIDESGTGVSIKTNAAPTALLDIAANTTARGQLRYRAGVDPTSPTVGSTWFTSNNLKISDGTTTFTFAKTLTNTATLNFGSTAAGTVSDLTITVTGAADGDAVSVGVPNASTVASGNFTAWVSATNTVTVRYSNNDLTTARDPASGTFRVSVVKY